MDEQLFRLLPDDAVLPDFVDIFSGEVHMQEANKLPLVCWPDSYPCIEANAFMISLLRRGLSRRGRGGTIAEYAKNISPLLRYCHQNEYSFTDLTDNSFTHFIRGLQTRDAFGEQARKCNEVIKIGRKCIDFLRFISVFHNDNTFIGPRHCRIIVEEREVWVKQKKGKNPFMKKYWSHGSFPDPDPVRKRHPIGNDVTKRLKEEARKTPDRGIRARHELMIACLEETDGRRTEVARIKVQDIEAADQQTGSAPLLHLRTAKKGNDRDTPVPRTFIQQAMKYIQRHRRRVIRNTIGPAEDHGYLLISHTKGSRLTDDTITTEVSKLCVKAGMSDKPGHPQLFRHAYISQKMKAIILQHDLNNKDDFRKALLNAEAFKLQLQQWTGHKNIDSLDTYIDLAFAELSHMEKSYNAIALGDSVRVALDRIESFKSDLGRLEPRGLLSEIEEMLNAFKDDIENAVSE